MYSIISLDYEKVVFPDGRPNEEVFDFSTGRFALQPQTNLTDFGFIQKSMTDEERTDFFLCTLAAGVPGLEDYVDLEPPNPLYDDWSDDPNQPDLSQEEADVELSHMRFDKFSEVFSDGLKRLPPKRRSTTTFMRSSRGL